MPQIPTAADTIAYIGLGSNVGDRLSFLQRAIEHVDRIPGVRIVAVSPVYESEPAGGPPRQGPFLNAALKVSAGIAAADLLDALHEIEERLGRRRSVRWGPRTIDLDLLLFGAVVIDSGRLCLPHPAMIDRAFVLAPLADLDPDLRDPVSGRSVRQLLAARSASGCRVAEGLSLQVTCAAPEP